MIHRVYIAGPYSNGDVGKNVRIAIDAANDLARARFSPYIPHLSHFWHLVYPHEYEFWTAHDLEWLDVCDAVLRLPGDSPGADREVERAQERGLPVFARVEEIVQHNNAEADGLLVPGPEGMQPIPDGPDD